MHFIPGRHSAISSQPNTAHRKGRKEREGTGEPAFGFFATLALFAVESLLGRTLIADCSVLHYSHAGRGAKSQPVSSYRGRRRGGRDRPRAAGPAWCR